MHYILCQDHPSMSQCPLTHTTTTTPQFFLQACGFLKSPKHNQPLPTWLEPSSKETTTSPSRSKAVISAPTQAAPRSTRKSTRSSATERRSTTIIVKLSPVTSAIEHLDISASWIATSARLTKLHATVALVWTEHSRDCICWRANALVEWTVQVQLTTESRVSRHNFNIFETITLPEHFYLGR